MLGETTMTTLDTTKALAKIKEIAEGREYLKLDEGTHDIKFLEPLNEPVEREINGKKVRQADQLVEYKGAKKKWSIPESASGLWGQLVKWDVKNGGVSGKNIKVHVTRTRGRDGNPRNQYAVID